MDVPKRKFTDINFTIIFTHHSYHSTVFAKVFIFAKDKVIESNKIFTSYLHTDMHFVVC